MNVAFSYDNEVTAFAPATVANLETDLNGMRYQISPDPMVTTAFIHRNRI